MQPDNTPPPVQPVANVPPAPVPAPSQPAPNVPSVTAAPQSVPDVSPSQTNYAGALFFTMLLVGFTFQLPVLLYVPVLFFCVIAGVLFFKDVLASKPQPAAGYTADGLSAVKPQRSKQKTIALVILSVVGIAILLFVAFVAFVLIMIGSSGV